MSISRLAFLIVLITYVLIVFGGYVASSESGMGCGPEWPLCNGDVIPTLQGETLVEFTHRVIGALLVVMTVVLYFKVKRVHQDSFGLFVAKWMLLLLIVQVIFGAVVVIYDLPVTAVTVHMLIALAFLACVIWLWRLPLLQQKDSSTHRNKKTKRIAFHLNTSLVLILLTIGFGAYIKHMHYGPACDWLMCEGVLLPSNSGQLLQTLHRVFGVLAGLHLLVLFCFSIYRGWGARIVNRLLFTLILVLLQIALGIITIVTNIELEWAVLHLAIGTALFAVVFDTRITLDVTQFHYKEKTPMSSGI